MKASLVGSILNGNLPGISLHENGCRGIAGKSSAVSDAFRILAGHFTLIAGLFCILTTTLPQTICAQETTDVLQVCATVPDLGLLAKEIGGDRVSVTVFARGPEDPHFLEAKPGFIKALSRADLLIEVGMDLEAGWLPVLQKNARNAAVLIGARGHLDASTAITPLDVPSGPVDRSMGDVHASGNPHYLLDPVNGLKVAKLIKDKLCELRPGNSQAFSDRYSAFRKKTAVAMVGEKLSEKYDFEKLALLFQHGKLESFLEEQQEISFLGGWLGRMSPFRGAKAIGDHNLWSYFSLRFGISVVGFLEPKPGVSPTTRYLSDVIALVNKDGVKIILKSPYFDPKPAQFVADKTGARIVTIVHQSGAAAGTHDYLAMVSYNVGQVADALGQGK